MAGKVQPMTHGSLLNEIDKAAKTRIVAAPLLEEAAKAIRTLLSDVRSCQSQISLDGNTISELRGSLRQEKEICDAVRKDREEGIATIVKLKAQLEKLESAYGELAVREAEAKAQFNRALHAVFQLVAKL